MRIWLDDVRPMPEGYDFWAKTAQEAWQTLVNTMDKDLFVSFDHDLGQYYTGYDLAKMIEHDCFHGLFPYHIGWAIHSANPVGRKNIEQAMGNADKYWFQHSQE